MDAFVFLNSGVLSFGRFQDAIPMSKTVEWKSR